MITEASKGNTFPNEKLRNYLDGKQMKYLLKIKRGIFEEFWFWYEALLSIFPGRIGYKIRQIGFIPFAKRMSFSVEIREGCHVWNIKNLFIGNNTRIGRGSIINASGGVEIGDNVRIGPRLFISSSDHNFSDKSISIKNQGNTREKVSIGSNTWIGANVSIMKGVTVGKNVVIAAGAVVTKNVMDGIVVAGIPAKKVRGTHTKI